MDNSAQANRNEYNYIFIAYLILEIQTFFDYRSEAEFKEFEPRFKFKPRLKYGRFHLKLYSIFQDLSWRSIETGFGVI